MLNGKKKVSFSMLLDRISSVILCADEAKSIYRILLYPFDTLRLHTCWILGGVFCFCPIVFLP